MRILAPRKRDSVTGEEAVLLSVTNAVVATTRQSNISTTTTSNNNNNVGQRTSGAPPRVDVLPEKLFNLVDCEGQHVYGSYTTAVVNYGNQNKKPVVVKKTSKLKNKESSSEEGNWRNRIGNKLADFWVVLNSYCCAAQEEAPPQESCRSEAEVEEDDEKSCPTKVNCGEAITIIVDEQQRQQESISKESEEECDAKSANINTSEESLPKIVTSSSNCSSTVNTSSKTPCIVITRTPDITTGESTHVKNTTKTASNVNPVAPNGTANFKTMRTGIYHEKQIKSLCALHALNNLLQDAKAFKQEDLDKICSELDPNSWVNPHKSVFGLGNYDINVIMTALQQKKLEAVWFDKRKDPSEELNFENIYGFILNIPSDCRLGWLALPIKRKHWVAIRNLPSVTERDNGRSNYYNLDSKFDKPESIGSTDNLIEYLRGELKSPEKELFLVVTEDIGRLETWRRNPPPAPSSSTTVGGAMTAASGSSTHLLPVPTGENGPDAAAGGGNNRRTSNDSGVVDLLPDLRDINVVDLNKEDLMRRQSSGVWSDLT